MIVPGAVEATAAAIAASLFLMSLHRPLLRTTIAIRRPVKFCCCRIFRSVVRSTSTPAASAASSNSPFRGYPSRGSGLLGRCDLSAQLQRLLACRCRGGRASAPRHRHVETPGSELERGFDLFARDGKLFQYLVNVHAVFQIFEDDCHWCTRALKYPRSTHLARDTFHRRALGPIEGGHLLDLLPALA